MDRVTAQYDGKEYADEETKESVMKQVGIILHDLEKNEVRRLITEEKIRPDGRKIDEVRPLMHKLIYYQEFMVLLYLQEVKHKFYLYVH